MSRHIDAEAFFKVINTLPYKDTSYPDASAYNGAISDAADMLTHFPAADVVEVRHGRWIVHGTAPWLVVECSNCGAKWHHWSGEKTNNYCGECGAIMDKEENE